MPGFNYRSLAMTSLLKTLLIRSFSLIIHSGLWSILLTDLLESDSFFLSYFGEESFLVEEKLVERAGSKDPAKVLFSASSMNADKS